MSPPGGRTAPAAQAAPGRPALDFDDDEAIRYWYARVLGWARAAGCPASDRDDLAQKTLTTAWSRQREVDVRHPSAFLYSVMRGHLSNQRRQAWYRFWASDHADVQLEVMSGGGGDPESEAIRRQRRDMLEEMLNNLRPKLREVFILREVEGHSNEEIAEILDIPAATVGSRLFEARRRLEEMEASRSRRDARRLG